MYTVDSYLAYLAISICATVMVARTLYKNGRVFLLDAFSGNTELADSVNHLLGFLPFQYRLYHPGGGSLMPLGSAREAVEPIRQKVGLTLVALGGIHMFNLYILSRMRRSAGPGAPRRMTTPAKGDETRARILAAALELVPPARI
jgi:hypothetical protein